MTENIVTEIKQNADKVYFPELFEKGISINRVAFKIPGIDLEVYWYGILIALGVFLALMYAYKKFKSFGLDSDRATDAIIGGIIGAVLGARIYWVIFNWSNYSYGGEIHWKQIFSYRDGGLAIYGGIIGGLAAASLICRIRKLKISPFFDIAAMGFLIGQCLGRWGNFFNQEAYGSLTTMPWGMTSNKIMRELSVLYPNSPTTDLVAHPTFLYESLWCLLGFILLSVYMKRRKFDGEIFILYAGWYGLGRSYFEGLRTDSLYIGDSSIRVSQLLAVICVIAAIVLLVYKHIQMKKAESYEFFYQTELSKLQIAESEDKYSKKTKINIAQAIDDAFDGGTKKEDTAADTAEPENSEDNDEQVD